MYRYLLCAGVSWLIDRFPTIRAVVPQSFYADPDPAVYFNADADPDPAAFLLRRIRIHLMNNFLELKKTTTKK